MSDADTLFDLRADRGVRVVAVDLLQSALAAARRVDDGANEQTVHDLRVSIRRLRSWLRAFKRPLEPDISRDVRRELRDIVRVTNAGRDAAVQLDWLRNNRSHFRGGELPGITWLTGRIEEGRQSTDEKSGEASERFTRLAGELRPRLSEGGPRRPADDGQRFGALLGEQLETHAEDLRRALERIGSAGDVKRAHKARIAAKRLRYLLEPAVGRRHPEDALLRRLRKLQNELGTLHDLHVFLETAIHERQARGSGTRRQGLKALESRLAADAADGYRRLRKTFNDSAMAKIEHDTEQLAGSLSRQSQRSMMKLRPIATGTRLTLSDADASPPPSAPGKSRLAKATEREVDRIGDLQEVLYADRRFALLIVLQGRDASGKDGTVKQVFKAVNPQGCTVTSFGVPSAEEARHDFLWRIHQHVPPRGMIGIFNRSHYEDVIVTRVRRTVPQQVLARRYQQINDFERMLTENGVVILKFFLHVSRDEQRKRLKNRLDDPTKNWKFQAGDLEDRANWSRYTTAYRDVLRRCSTPSAPWYLVPADDKKVRNLLVSRVIADRLDALGLRYPPAPKATRRLKVT